MKVCIQTLRDLLLFTAHFFCLSMFLHRDLELLNGVDIEMSVPTLLKEKFVAVLTLGMGEDLRRLYYRRLISALRVKGKSVSSLV